MTPAVTLLPTARGTGIGTEALQLLLYYAFELRNLHRLESAAKSLNTPSVKMMLRAGFRKEGEKRAAVWHLGRFVDVSLFAILDEDYFSKKALEMSSSAHVQV